MSYQPAPPCCPPDSLPALAPDPNYVTKGQEVTYGAHRAYIVGEGGNLLVMAADAFGMDSGLHKRLADEISASIPGTTVIVPNFFVEEPNGELVPPNGGCCFWVGFICRMICCGGLKKTFGKYTWAASSKSVFDEAVNYVIANRGAVSKVAVAGFCWGGYVCVKATGGDTKHADIVCGAIQYHTSAMNVLKFTGENQTTAVEAIRCPHLILSSSMEPKEWQPNGYVINTLKPKFPLSACYTYKQSHGFMARGDLKNAETAKVMNESMNHTLQFLKEVFKSA